jgi:hypothetical protein
MATPIVEKLRRRERGEGKDHSKIELSSNQMTPGDALAPEFVVLTPDQGITAEVPSHGQHGRSKSDHRKLLQKSAADRGKSPLRKRE